MAEDLTKKAAEMLLRGATLVSQPCPYCSGVRVIKDGNALCTSCGRRPGGKETGKDATVQAPAALQILEKKLDALSRELEGETDHGRQQEIIRAVDSLIDAIAKLKDGNQSG